VIDNKQKAWFNLILLLSTSAIMSWFWLKEARSNVAWTYVIYVGGVVGFFIYSLYNDVNHVVSIGVCAVTITSGFATFYGWWDNGFDNYIHLSIHFLVGIMAYRLWSRHLESGWLILLVSMSMVVLFGYFIEMVEYLLWELVEVTPAPLGMFYADTMDDFLYDIAGGFIGVGLAWFFYKR